MLMLKKMMLGLVVLTTAMGVSLKMSEPKSIYPLDENLGITEVPSSLGQRFFKCYDRATKIVAPNGKPIFIVAQSDITNEQIVRSRNILKHYLTDYSGSKYGNNKSDIANQMANNGAILTLLNGSDDGNIFKMLKLSLSGIIGQALYKDEIQVEGHSWYMNQNYKHRDAAFEEILHLVHDYGIGVDGPNSSPGAAPEFQEQIRAAQVNGLKNKLWADDEKAIDWIKELEEENSLSQEYLASVIDVYYGLWGAFKENNRGMWGLYIAKNRDDIKEKDPLAFQLMDDSFFHPYLTYNARIDASLNGYFSLKFDAGKAYTHHSQYLKDITLTGSNNSSVTVNEMDNDITGNTGTNTVIFSGAYADYTVTTTDGVTMVKDNTANRDGNNSLRKVEKIQFSDKTVTL